MKPIHESPRQRLSRLSEKFPVARRLLKGPRYLIGIVLFLLALGLVVTAISFFSAANVPFSQYLENIIRGA